MQIKKQKMPRIVKVTKNSAYFLGKYVQNAPKSIYKRKKLC